MKITFTKKRIIIWVIVAFLAFMSVYAGIQAGKIAHMTTLDEEVQNALDKPPEKGKFNVLVLGVDKDGSRADTIMIFSVDNVSKSIKVLSIPRDTMVSNNGRNFKINACLGFESREAFMIEKIKEITNMPIHYYCELNFMGIRNIVDILGGVDYNVPMKMDYEDPAQDLYIHLEAGPQHLNGNKAEQLLRYRKGYLNQDLGRIDTQQDFIAELFKQKMQPKYLLKAVEIINAAYPHVQTNFTITSALEFVNILKSTETTNIQGFVLPVEGKYINNVSYVIHNPEQTKKLIADEFGYPEK